MCRTARTEWHLHCGRVGEAEQSARQSLTIADADRRRQTAEQNACAAHADLCEIMFIRGAWEDLRGHAMAGEELARRHMRMRSLLGFLLWGAILARHDGDEAKARRLLRQAAARKARMRSVLGMSFDDALCAFHEMGGELGAALRRPRPGAKDGRGQGTAAPRVPGARPPLPAAGADGPAVGGQRGRSARQPASCATRPPTWRSWTGSKRMEASGRREPADEVHQPAHAGRSPISSGPSARAGYYNGARMHDSVPGVGNGSKDRPSRLNARLRRGGISGRSQARRRQPLAGYRTPATVRFVGSA